MATPDEWLQCVFSVVDQLALLFAGTPDDRVEASLAGFADRTRAGWREAFHSLLRDEDIDSVVADVVDRIRKRRREIEASGTIGMA
jgi:hypothetical protein